MSIKINISESLRLLAGLPETTEVDGSTIGECLDALVRKYPDSKKWLFDESGKPRIMILINQGREQVGDLERPVKAGDDLYLLMIVGGG